MKETYLLPESIMLCEKSVREGFQPKEKFIPTKAKLFLVDALADAGFRHIEIGDYSDPDVAPQFRDLDEVLTKLERKPGVEYICVTLNRKAVERAVEAKNQGYGPDMIEIVIATSEPRNEANFGMKHTESWKLIEDAVGLTREVGIKPHVTIVTIWSCPFQGRMNPSLAVEFVDRLADMGYTSIGHSDPYGDASPLDVFQYFRDVLSHQPGIQHVFHYHDRRGFGLANYVAAMQAGIKRFDTTMGGTGGWFASIVDGVPIRGATEYNPRPGKTGLVSTEDFVVMCDAMGIKTDVDVDKVLNIGKWMEKIVGQKLWSFSLPYGKVTK